MKALYKYPQCAFPYSQLVAENGRRGLHDPEFDLVGTGAFNQERYFDVFIEYAKAAPEDISIRVTIHNRGPELASLEVLPTVWFRNTWSWNNGSKRPNLRISADGIEIDHRGLNSSMVEDLGLYHLQAVARRLSSLFQHDESGDRPCHGSDT